jgi:RNA polymerase sigma-54 factor
MALELRQNLKLSQQLVMTPQLQQAIKLLQLSRIELQETVERELMENPMLEEAMEEERPSSENAETDFRKTKSDDDPSTVQDLQKNAEWDDYLGEFSSTAKQAQSREAEIPEDGMAFDARLSAKHTLEGHLQWQLRLSAFTEREMEIGEIILSNLETTGYLKADKEELSELAHCSMEEMESVISRIQRFDPIGVAASSPQECLLVQLEAAGYDDPILTEIIKEHLGDLEKRRYKPLARKFKISMEEIKEYLDILQSLDPMPGASFGSYEPHYVSPDVYVYKYDGKFVIVMNDDGLPRLQLNSFYLEGTKATNSTGAKDKEYLQDKMRSAVWLMKSLYQRQRTLYKVVESIINFQRKFFESGVTQLKPLILKDVADDIQMHESTVSRITTNKYVATPHGVYELKFFFNSALGMDDGSQVGSESVKALIKKLIAEENPKKPLSDEKIADILKDELQVNIARRTVAKYRGALNILSSSKRKQIF